MVRVPIPLGNKYMQILFPKESSIIAHVAFSPQSAEMMLWTHAKAYLKGDDDRQSYLSLDWEGVKTRKKLGS